MNFHLCEMLESYTKGPQNEAHWSVPFHQQYTIIIYTVINNFKVGFDLFQSKQVKWFAVFQHWNWLFYQSLPSSWVLDESHLMIEAVSIH
jgi:hypothetical protein